MATTTTIPDADKQLSNMPVELVDALVPYFNGGVPGTDPVETRNYILTWLSAGHTVRGIRHEHTAGRIGQPGFHPNQVRIKSEQFVKNLLDGVVGT